MNPEELRHSLHWVLQIALRGRKGPVSKITLCLLTDPLFWPTQNAQGPEKQDFYLLLSFPSEACPCLCFLIGWLFIFPEVVVARVKFHVNTTELVKILQYMYPQTCKMAHSINIYQGFPRKSHHRAGFSGWIQTVISTEIFGVGLLIFFTISSIWYYWKMPDRGNFNQ